MIRPPPEPEYGARQGTSIPSIGKECGVSVLLRTAIVSASAPSMLVAPLFLGHTIGKYMIHGRVSIPDWLGLISFCVDHSVETPLLARPHCMFGSPALTLNILPYE